MSERTSVKGIVAQMMSRLVLFWPPSSASCIVRLWHPSWAQGCSFPDLTSRSKPGKGSLSSFPRRLRGRGSSVEWALALSPHISLWLLVDYLPILESGAELTDETLLSQTNWSTCRAQGGQGSRAQTTGINERSCLPQNKTRRLR